MSESVVVELYENETFHSGKWCTDPDIPWTTKDNFPSRPHDELTLPGAEWSWASNWRIDKKPGYTDREGWEYASRLDRFQREDRSPKIEKGWNDKARRRKWSRIMRRDARVGNSIKFNDTVQKIQGGLRSIQIVRRKVEEVVSVSPDAIHTPEMEKLIDSVRTNIESTSGILDNIEGMGVSNNEVMILKKFRNDISKEQAAIDRALRQTVASTSTNQLGFTKLTRQSTFGGISRREDDFVPLQKSSMSFAGEKAAASSMVTSGRRDEPFRLAVNADASKGLHVEEGVYLSAELQEQMILKKLVPVSEEKVQEQLIEERAVAIEEIYKGLVEVNELFIDLSREVKNQQEHVGVIFDNANESHAKTAEAFAQIVEANRLQQESNCVVM